jgi:4-amino-4-deoxy-L-arabinose transferase-like glycosyltransferase
LLVLVLGFGALNFFLLGGTPLANPDEARYAQIPREMIEAGDWVIGRLNGVPYLEKPPLVYWMIGLCHRLFGPGEWSMRLTPALSGLAGVLLVYAATRRLHSRTAGIAAAVVLGTSLLHFGLSRVLLLDIVLSLWLSAALFCFILGVREPAGARRRWLFYGMYAAAALATLTKGLIGFLIPGAVMFLWLLVFNQWRRLRPFYLPSGLLLFLAIALPWHVVAAQRHPDWVQFYLVREHWERFTQPGHGRTEPWWFFVAVLVAGFFPWIGFLGGAVRDAVAGGWKRRGENAEAWFLVTWALFIFLFFSKSQSKLIPYLLPIFPALAALVGTWLARCRGDGGAPRLRVGFRVFAFGCGVLGVALVVAVLKPGLIPPVENPSALTPPGLAMGAVLLTGGVMAPWWLRLQGVKAGLAALLATIVAFQLLLALVAPSIQRISTKPLALVARERVQPADRVFHYWAFFHDFVYYSGRPVGLVSWVDELVLEFLPPAERAARFIDEAELLRQWSGPGRVWVVVRKRDQAQPKSVFANPGFRYHLIAETRGHSLISNQP